MPYSVCSCKPQQAIVECPSPPSLGELRMLLMTESVQLPARTLTLHIHTHTALSWYPSRISSFYPCAALVVTRF